MTFEQPRRLLASLVLLSLASASTLPAQSGKPLYQDTTQSAESRAANLVSRMTLKEKVGQMQDGAPAIDRLGVPQYRWWNESLHGVARVGYVTVFPTGIGLGATWDPGLINAVADRISTEGRAHRNEAANPKSPNHFDYYRNGLDYWSPNINIFRDPRWGRGQETYGEDPYLSGTLVTQYVKGLQGSDPKFLKAISTPKHYAVHSGPEPTRHEFDAIASLHDINDTYLPAFRAGVIAGGARSVMCSYNRINGVPACASQFLLNDTLRTQWGFKGYVVSDCGAIGDITKGHKFTADDAAGSAAAVKAGTDIDCGEPSEYSKLTDAVQRGLITEKEIDRAVTRLFEARFRLGLFDPDNSYAYGRIPASEGHSAEGRALALRAARESIVLLKNDKNLLPLKAAGKKILVTGPNAAMVLTLEGNYNGTPERPVRPLDGILARFGKTSTIRYEQGSTHTDATMVPIPRSVLHPAAGSRVQGLRAEYFNNNSLTGKPALVRLDHEMDFDSDGDKVFPQVSRDAFSIRWTGTITAPGAGDYSFKVNFSHRWFEDKDEAEVYRIFVDGKLVAEGKNQDRPKVLYHFQDASAHAFKVEYSHKSPRLGGGVTIGWIPAEEPTRNAAIEAAKKSDVVIAVLGLTSFLEGEEYPPDPLRTKGFNGGDRTLIELPDVQEKLLEGLAATGKPVVLVLLNGSALAVPWAKEHVAAILDAWYPGVEGGTAIAETLAGDNNPSGRLPVTFYRATADLPAFEDYSLTNRTYRYFTGKPLFGFGYGLSYSKFNYSNLKLSTHSLNAGDDLVAEAEITNLGKVAGDEVAELYLMPQQIPGASLRTLQGFQRIHLAPGESRHVVFTLGNRQLSTVAPDGARRIAAGTYGIAIGGAQPEEAESVVTGSFAIQGELTLPR
jgi:beta-glucosidase